MLVWCCRKTCMISKNRSTGRTVDEVVKGHEAEAKLLIEDFFSLCVSFEHLCNM